MSRSLADSPEYEDEQNEQREEYCDIVHCAKHHKQLTSQIRHETYQFQDAQQSKCTQNTETGTTFAFAKKLLTQFEHTVRHSNEYNCNFKNFN